MKNSFLLKDAAFDLISEKAVGNVNLPLTIVSKIPAIISILSFN